MFHNHITDIISHFKLIIPHKSTLVILIYFYLVMANVLQTSDWPYVELINRCVESNNL